MAANKQQSFSILTMIQRMVVFFLKMISYLPLWFLYLKSNFFYYILEYVIGYRRKVVDENLMYAFPEKSKEERDMIRKRYYRHLCDLMVESVKLYSISEKEIDKRMVVKNIDLLKEISDEVGFVLLSMHHNNWEWGSYMQKKSFRRILLVYNRMRNNAPFDDYLLKTRTRWGGQGVVMSQAARTAFDYNRKKEPVILWLAADQSAPPDSQFWAVFMNRETPFFAGPVRLAQKLNQPIYFQHNRKVGRGKYEIELTLLFKEPAKEPAEKILLTYLRKMEEVIREEPEFYLWSHRRWKHTRPEGIELIQ